MSISMPRSASFRSLQTGSRSMLITYAPVDARKPGANSSVTQAPPTNSRRSRMSGFSPAFAR